MWIRKRIDIEWSDLAHCCVSSDRSYLRRQIATWWAAPDEILVCLAVRAGFDLLLQSLALPPKSEIVLSAVNISGTIASYQFRL